MESAHNVSVTLNKYMSHFEDATSLAQISMGLHMANMALKSAKGSFSLADEKAIAMLARALTFRQSEIYLLAFKQDRKRPMSNAVYAAIKFTRSMLMRKVILDQESARYVKDFVECYDPAQEAPQNPNFGTGWSNNFSLGASDKSTPFRDENVSPLDPIPYRRASPYIMKNVAKIARPRPGKADDVSVARLECRRDSVGANLLAQVTLS